MRLLTASPLCVPPRAEAGIIAGGAEARGEGAPVDFWGVCQEAAGAGAAALALPRAAGRPLPLLHLAVASGSAPMVDALLCWLGACRVGGQGGGAGGAGVSLEPWLCEAAGAAGASALHLAACASEEMAWLLLERSDVACAAWLGLPCAAGPTPAALAEARANRARTARGGGGGGGGEDQDEGAAFDAAGLTLFARTRVAAMVEFALAQSAAQAPAPAEAAAAPAAPAHAAPAAEAHASSGAAQQEEGPTAQQEECLAAEGQSGQGVATEASEGAAAAAALFQEERQRGAAGKLAAEEVEAEEEAAARLKGFDPKLPWEPIPSPHKEKSGTCADAPCGSGGLGSAAALPSCAGSRPAAPLAGPGAALDAAPAARRGSLVLILEGTSCLLLLILVVEIWSTRSTRASDAGPRDITPNFALVGFVFCLLLVGACAAVAAEWLPRRRSGGAAQRLRPRRRGAGKEGSAAEADEQVGCCRGRGRGPGLERRHVETRLVRASPCVQGSAAPLKSARDPRAVCAVTGAAVTAPTPASRPAPPPPPQPRPAPPPAGPPRLGGAGQRGDGRAPQGVLPWGGGGSSTHLPRR
jgi:hypothetical protein